MTLIKNRKDYYESTVPTCDAFRIRFEGVNGKTGIGNRGKKLQSIQ